MSDPATNAVSGITLATGAITLTGSIFGLQFDALLFGLFGGLISLMHLPSMSVLKLVGTLASAAVLGALGAPIAPALAKSYFEWFAMVPPDAARLGSALAVGLFAQGLIPVGLAWLERKRAANQSGGGS